MSVGLQKEQVKDFFTEKTCNYENLWVSVFFFFWYT